MMILMRIGTGIVNVMERHVNSIRSIGEGVLMGSFSEKKAYNVEALRQKYEHERDKKRA